MRTFSRGIVSALLKSWCIVFLSSALFAQSTGNSGTISGTVTDPTGALVPGAAVTIHNPVSHYERTATTDKTGHFQFTNVPFNPYHLAVTMAYTVDLVSRNLRSTGRPFGPLAAFD